MFAWRLDFADPADGGRGMIQIKGSVLKARLAFANEREPGGAEAVLQQLPVEDQAALRSLLATSWYPFDLGQRLDRAIVDLFGKGKPEFFEQIGEASAEKNLTGVHKHFLVAGDPQAFLARAPMVYSFYYDRGRREYEKTGEREAVLTTLDAEVFSLADCATVVGWHRKALEMCGARNPRVVEEECRARGASVCRYRLNWT
jgi:uncharacterized protein (TIGR02265 family)